ARERGARRWREPLSSAYDEHSAWPLYAEPHLLIASPFRSGARLYRLEETGGAVRTAWVSKVLSNDVCSSLLVAGNVYGFDLQQLQASTHRPSRGRFKCIDFPTPPARWGDDRRRPATVLAADGKLILLDETGTLILARADPAAYEELARAKVLDGDLSWTPPALSDGRLFVRNHSRAACVFLGPKEALDPNRPTVAAPRSGWRFDWAELLTREPGYPHDAPSARELARWFVWCVAGVFGPAVVIADAVWLLARLLRSGRPGVWSRSAFVAAALLLGLIGTTALSAWADAFVLTWPA